MPIHRLFSAAFIGLEAVLVEVEVDLVQDEQGSIRIVGLPDAAVKESKDRVTHAIKNIGCHTKAFSGVVHLAPAEIKKIGAFYDLPIALGMLAGLGILPSKELEHFLIGGELSLSGEIRPITGVLALSLLAKKKGKKGVIVPFQNGGEAALVQGIEVIALNHLSQGIGYFKENIALPKPQPLSFTLPKSSLDMSTIKGQSHAKRALEIAAAGSHNVLMSGPPGTGKTMLAKAFSGILPPLLFEEALEITNIYSLAGLGSGLMTNRPFRSPHHSISYVGMIGGGSPPKPGEISLAHKGVLFLDELPEFSRATLEVLRQPLEDKEITVSRSGGKARFPTEVIFVAAMNPCPCGYLGHPDKPCRDSSLQIERYQRKISGPLLDRIDLHLEIPPVPYKDMLANQPEESSADIQKRVTAARERLRALPIPSHSSLPDACKNLLKDAVEAFHLSARSLTKLIKVAHTISSLENKDAITEDHLAEALSYRFK